MTRWHRVNTSKLTWTECRRQAPDTVTFAVLALMKLIGKGLPVPGAVPRLADPAIVPGEALPPSVASELAHRVRALASLPESFRVLFHQAPPHRGGSAAHAVVLLSEDGRTVARVTHATAGAKKQIVTALHSWGSDGTFIGTGDKAQEFDAAPRTSSRHAPGADAATLAATHREHVATAARKRGVRVLTEAEVPAALLAYDQAAVDHLVRRGILVPLSDQELAGMS